MNTEVRKSKQKKSGDSVEDEKGRVWEYFEPLKFMTGFSECVETTGTLPQSDIDEPSQVVVRQEKEQSSLSGASGGECTVPIVSHAAKKKKKSNSKTSVSKTDTTDGDGKVVEEALAVLRTPKDDCDVFGELVAVELRQIHSLERRRKLTFRTSTTMDRFDTELFIDEVKKRPAIWDIQCTDYSKKNAKNEAWQELVELFGDGEDSMEKKALFGTTLQKKWKNVRDAYHKEYKKSKTVPSGSGVRKGTQYVYFERLSFLQKCVENKETASNIEEQINEVSQERNNEENDSFVNANEIHPLQNKRKKTKSMSEERLSDLIEKTIQSRDKLHQELQEAISNQDEDKLFCSSLYKELKKVPENKRLATKIELLQVIQKGQTLSSPVRSTTQHTVPTTLFWHSHRYSNPQGFFTASEAPSAVISPASSSPSSYVNSDSQSSIIENICTDVEY